MKFKVGDKVRIFPFRKIGYVLRTNPSDNTYLINITNDSYTTTGWFNEYELKLISTTDTNFKVGDKVRVIQNPSKQGWIDEMEPTIGQIGKISYITTVGDIEAVGVEFPGYCWTYHAYDLELVEEEKETNLSHFPHKCPQCGAPAYIGLMSVECSKGCQF